MKYISIKSKSKFFFAFYFISFTTSLSGNGLRSVPLWFNHLFRHPFLCGEVKRGFKSWTSITNVNMPALIQVLWGHIWECTLEKSQTNATRTPFIQSSCQTSFPLCREVKRDFNAGQVDRQDGTDLHSKVRIISHHALLVYLCHRIFVYLSHRIFVSLSHRIFVADAFVYLSDGHLWNPPPLFFF